MKRRFLLLTLAVFALLSNAAWSQQEYKIVFHVDSADSTRLEMAFHNAHSAEMNAGKGNIRMIIVANGPAVKLFLKSNAGSDSAEIAKLVSTGDVAFHICGTSLKAFGYKPSDVISDCVVVPAGVLDIARLEGEGYSYIKP